MSPFTPRVTKAVSPCKNSVAPFRIYARTSPLCLFPIEILLTYRLFPGRHWNCSSIGYEAKAMKSKIYLIILTVLSVAMPVMAFELKNPDNDERLRIELQEIENHKKQNSFDDYVSELAASARGDEVKDRTPNERSFNYEKYKPWNPIVLFRW